MMKRVRQWLNAHAFACWFYPIGIGVTVLLFLFTRSFDGGYGWAYLAAAAVLVVAARPKSWLHTPTVEPMNLYKTLLTLLAALVTIAVCVGPMGDLSLWNGEDPGHRNQYEVMAESILDGHIDMYYNEADPLAGVENPYDPAQRQGIVYPWDHAYYEGHYYMYFGVVPVFLTFLPYRAVTGETLLSYQATQLFVAVFIAGIFALFRMLSKRFFKDLPFAAYLCMSVAVSVMSVWYAAAEPALYCTAITAALALMVWSLFFFIKAVYVEKRENRQILWAAIGALFGALVFGCRPTIALANLLVVPMLIAFLRQRKFSWGLLGKLSLAALPYLLVGGALMLYNYVRFDSPFEFGQAYQLTVADQTAYAVKLDKAALMKIANGFLRVFCHVGSWKEAFPYINVSGVFWNFPLLLMGVALFRAFSVRAMHKQRVLSLAWSLPVTVVIIVAMGILWTPYWLERYDMDIYFLLGIACFMAVGFWYASCGKQQRRRLSSAVVLLSGITVISAFLYYVGTVGGYYPDKVREIGWALHLM